MILAQFIIGSLGLACMILSVVLFRKGHPFWVLGLVILNAGLFCTYFMFRNYYPGLLSESFHYSSLLITFGIYVFIKNLQTKKLSTKDKFILGFTLLEPLFIFTLMMLNYFDPQYQSGFWSIIFAPVDYLLPVGEERAHLYIRWKMFFFYAFVISFILVFLKLLKFLKEAKSQHLSFFTNDSFQYYYWLERFVTFFGIVCLYAAALVLINQFVYQVSSQWRVTLYIAMAIFGLGIFMLGIYTPLRFGNEKDFKAFVNHIDSIFLENENQPEASGHSNIESQKLKLQSLIESDSLYRDPQLSLSLLADRMDVSTRTLSRVINQGFDKNFYDLINYHRIEEVKSKLVHSDYAHYSILSIGLEAGFNSKSTFYNVFKKSTGMTPSQYKKLNT